MPRGDVAHKSAVGVHSKDVVGTARVAVVEQRSFPIRHVCRITATRRAAGSAMSAQPDRSAWLHLREVEVLKFIALDECSHRQVRE
jgi:hypothetical protein